MKKSKKKFNYSIESYGRYTTWNKSSRELPKIIEFTNIIEAMEGNEFGLILSIKGGKGAKLHFVIQHPPFLEKNFEITPDFTGEQIVASNDYKFFVGDSIWQPVDDKIGEWIIKIFYDKKQLVQKTFKIV